MISKKIGIVHGRFQPPHNGHVRYILEALENAPQIIIGICTPQICSLEDAKLSGYPCSEKENPLSFEERATLLRGALSAHGIEPSRYSFIPFPSDYKNIENIISKDCIFFISRSSEGDDKKISYLTGLGYETQTILETKESRTESGQNIRELIEKQMEWKHLVPESVAEFLAQKFGHDM